MAVIEQAQTDQRVVLHGVSWEFYEMCLREIGNRGIRLTYDRGTLEIMSPSKRHEWYKRLLGRLIETLTEELNIPIQSTGSTTWRREAQRRGLEADECYYIQNEPLVRGRDEADLDQDPPPDLAIEVEISRAMVARMPIYATIGIPEIWRYDGQRIFVHCRQPAGHYETLDASPTFSDLPLREVERFLAQRATTDETTVVRAFRAWVREHLLPRGEGPLGP